jgi:hypothetical protein
MKRNVTTEDILASIEFELAQSAITKTDLGAGLNAVREFQNKARSELIGTPHLLGDTRAIVNQQYQINDMHLTLLQEMAAAVQAIQLDVRRLGQLASRPSTAVTSHAPATTGNASVIGPAATSSMAIDASPVMAEPSDTDLFDWLVKPVEDAMKPDALRVKRDVRSSNIPVLGWFVRRVRLALHDLTLFYLDQLVQRQTGINQTVGESLLDVMRVVEQQQQEIDELRAQVAALQAGRATQA